MGKLTKSGEFLVSQSFLIRSPGFPFFILSKRVLWCGKCIFLAIYSNISYKICPTMKNVRILKFGNVLFKVHCILCRKIMVLLLESVSIEMITNKLCIFIILFAYLLYLLVNFPKIRGPKNYQKWLNSDPTPIFYNF